MSRGTSVPGRRLGATLSLLTGLQILASVALQALLITRLGAGVETDAFYAGATLSQVIAVIAIDTLAVVLVPLLASKAEEDLRSHAWSLCLVAISAFTALALLLALAAPAIAAAIVPGFSVEGQALTAKLTRIHLLGMGGTACTLILTAIYQVQGRFLWPPLSALAASSASFALVFVTLDRWGITVAAWAQVLAFSCPAAVMLAALGRPARLEWRWDLVREVIARQKPLMLSKAYFAASAPFDRLLVSFLPPGSLVIFELVGRLFAAAQRMISQGVIAPLLPQLARLAKEQEWRRFRAVSARQAMWVITLTVAVVAAVELTAVGTLSWFSGIRGPVVGSLTGDNLRQLAWLAALLAGVLPCTVLGNVFANAYYAQEDTSTPSRIAALALTAALFLRAAGFWLGGIEGLAVATTLAALVPTVWLGAKLNARTRGLMQARELPNAAPFRGLPEAKPS